MPASRTGKDGLPRRGRLGPHALRRGLRCRELAVVSPARGEQRLSPAQLAMVPVLQSIEDLTDQPAAEAVDVTVSPWDLGARPLAAVPAFATGPGLPPAR